MKCISKLSGELAINSKTKPFIGARLRLASWYTAGVCVVVIVFSLAVYSVFAKDITGNADPVEQTPRAEIDRDNQIINNARARLRIDLFAADSLIIMVTVGLSYWVAGKTLRPIELAYDKQKKFVADAAHELRTPLAVMKTGAETALAGKAGKQELEKLTHESLDEINFLSETVNELLFLANSDTGQKEPFTKLNFGELLHRQVGLMCPYGKQKQTRLIEDIEQNAYISANKGQLKRLVTNIIQNAVEYSPAESSIKVSLVKIDHQAKLVITDNGIGISEQDLEQIFDRFYKADRARTDFGGAGLGLSIVQEIVELHKGKIVIKSKVGEGTIVIVFLSMLS